MELNDFMLTLNSHDVTCHKENYLKVVCDFICIMVKIAFFLNSLKSKYKKIVGTYRKKNMKKAD